LPPKAESACRSSGICRGRENEKLGGKVNLRELADRVYPLKVEYREKYGRGHSCELLEELQRQGIIPSYTFDQRGNDFTTVTIKEFGLVGQAHSSRTSDSNECAAQSLLSKILCHRTVDSGSKEVVRDRIKKKDVPQNVEDKINDTRKYIDGRKCSARECLLDLSQKRIINTYTFDNAENKIRLVLHFDGFRFVGHYKKTESKAITSCITCLTQPNALNLVEIE